MDRSTSMKSVVGTQTDWIDVQKRTYTAWSNAMLRLITDRTLEIKDLTTDFKDGVLLSFLIQAASGVPSIKRNEPTAGKELIKQKAIENINAALDVATRDGVKLTNIGANDIYDGNPKLINGLVWSLILKYQIGQEGGAKKMLLDWVNEVLPGAKVNDFKKSWADGKMLAHLVNALVPDSIPDSDIQTLPPVPLTRKSQEVAQDKMGVPIIVPAEDLVECGDENIQMMMLSYFRNWQQEKAGNDSPSTVRRKKGSVPPPIVIKTPVKAETSELTSPPPTPKDLEELERLRRERDQITSEAAGLRSSMALLQDSKSSDESEIERLRKSLTEKTREAEVLEAKNQEKQTVIQSISDNLETQKSELEMLKQRNHDLQNELDSNKGALDQQKQENEELREELDKLKSARAENEKLRKQVEASLVEHDALVTSSAANEDRVNELTEQIKEKDEMIDKLVNRDIASLRAAMKHKDEEAKKLKETLKAMAGEFKQDLLEMAKQRDDSLRELEKLKGKVSAYSKQLILMQEQIAQSTSGDMEQLESELQKMTLKNEEMQQSINKLEAEMLEATKRAEALMAMLNEAKLFAGEDADLAFAPSAGSTDIDANSSESKTLTDHYQPDQKLKDRLANAESQVLSLIRFRAEKEAQIAELVKQNEENVELLHTLDRRIKSGMTEKSQLVQQVSDLTEQVNGLKRELDVAQNATTVCESNRSELNGKVDELEKNIAKIQSDFERAKKDLDNARSENEELRNRQSKFEGGNQVLADQLSSLDGQTNELRTALDLATKELKEKEKALEESMQATTTCETSRGVLQVELGLLRERVTNLEDELIKSQTALTEAKEAFARSEAELEKARQELESATEQARVAREEVARGALSQDSVLKVEHDKLVQTEQALHEKEKALEAKQQEIESAQLVVQEKEKVIEAQQAELAQAKEEIQEKDEMLQESLKSLEESGRISAERQKALDALGDKEATITLLNEKISKLNGEMQLYKDQLHELQPKMAHLVDAASTAGKLDTQLQAAHSELKKLQAGESGEITLLTKQLKAKEGELHDLRCQFQAAMEKLSEKLAAAESAAKEAQRIHTSEQSPSSTLLKYIVPLGLVVIALGAGRLLSTGKAQGPS